MASDAPNQNAPLGEEEIIRLISSMAGRGSGELKLGIGDDAAVLRPDGGLWCVTTDLLVEGVHFDLSYMSPFELGRRAMAANLSDLAAMGSVPRHGFLSLGLPENPTRSLVEGIVHGLVDLGREHGLTLAGGDTVRSPVLTLNLCLVGCCRGYEPCLRSGAREGDAVCVTGGLGASRAGLAWLQAGLDPKDPLAQDAVKAHLDPAPRVEAGRLLARSGRAHAMMDVSDGLATDLARLCEASGLGAELAAEKVPVSKAAVSVARRLGADALDWALTGGEDFELLFTCDPDDVGILGRVLRDECPEVDLFDLGRTTRGKGVSLLDAGGGRREIGFFGFRSFQKGELMKLRAGPVWLCLALFLAAWLCPAPAAHCADQVKQKMPPSAPVRYLPDPPEKMTLCGEPVPLNLPFVSEQLDREFNIQVHDQGQVVMWMKARGALLPLH